ncbi:winged helix-turn-helix domain-containing protein [Halostella litorea]|uniref:winged helix-turn-helix domain-containing protein n=1 Tax=Halostella litorea TaxID=2528831 RepID=UPI001F3C259D|nr:winged helix-turn-helix domain-containing protein [Halostella litorea]
MIAQHESVALMVDALLDLPPHREFNQSELANLAGVSRQSVSRHLDLLTTLGIIEPAENPGTPRYRFNPESEVSEALIRLDGAVNAVGAETSS